MKHRNSHFAVGYWSRIRNGRLVPDQADIDPRALKNLLPFVFILDARPVENPVYRLAGTTLCERYGGELRGHGFLTHWDVESRTRISRGLSQALAQCSPACITSIGATEDCRMVEIETVLMPISFGSGKPERFLGVAQVMSDVAPLVGNSISLERLVSMRLIPENENTVGAEPPHKPPRGGLVAGRAPYLMLVADNGSPPDPLHFDLDKMLQQMFQVCAAVGRHARD